jgi:hypothetical protein
MESSLDLQRRQRDSVAGMGKIALSLALVGMIF